MKNIRAQFVIATEPGPLRKLFEEKMEEKFINSWQLPVLVAGVCLIGFWVLTLLIRIQDPAGPHVPLHKGMRGSLIRRKPNFARRIIRKAARNWTEILLAIGILLVASSLLTLIANSI